MNAGFFRMEEDYSDASMMKVAAQVKIGAMAEDAVFIV